jgi:ATP-binding cassette subfamily F protein uup
VRKLSYHEQLELDQLPENIEALEARIGEIQQEISDASFYAQGHDVTGPVLAELSTRQSELDHALERWTELEDRVRLYNESRK